MHEVYFVYCLTDIRHNLAVVLIESVFTWVLFCGLSDWYSLESCCSSIYWFMRFYFVDCLTDIRQNLAAPRLVGKQENSATLSDLLQTTHTAILEQVKSVLANLQVNVTLLARILKNPIWISNHKLLPLQILRPSPLAKVPVFITGWGKVASYMGLVCSFSGYSSFLSYYFNYFKSLY